MRIKTILLFCLISSRAYATTMDGNELYKRMKDENQVYNNYISGYIAGLYDTIEVYDTSISNCVGEKVRMSQFIDVVKNWLEKNTAQRNKHPFDIFNTAVREAFKCTR